MALELVTGYKGQNHVTADQWADFNRSIYGTAAILPVGNKMAVEIQTANQITVKDGVAVFDGRQIYIGYGESENVAIESGTQAMLRNDIVVVKYTKNEETGVESVAFEVITGVPAVSDPVDPSYQDMDIRTGVFTSQKAFCRVRLNGVAIEGIDMLVDVKEINDHAFAAPANNLTTATPGTALDAAMGKKLQEEYDQLNGDIASLTEKTTMSWSGVDTDVVLTTKAWTQADGGFSWSVPTTGWYYLQAKFTKTKDGSDYTGDMQFHLKSKKNDGIRYNTISKLSSMTVVELNTVARLVEGDKIFPNVHTAQAGLKLNTRLFVVLLNKI